MKVSIIIPYREDRGWLKTAMDSVPLSLDVELIVVKGDGSWPCQFNHGLHQATGELIKWLHEDDKIMPGSIGKCVEFFKRHPEVDFIHGRAVEFYTGQRPNNYYTPAISHPTLNDLVARNVFHSTTLMYRKRVFDIIGLMNESWDIYSFEELEFNLRCLKGGMNVGYINDIIGMYRRHPKQIIRTCDKVKRRNDRNRLLNCYL